MLLSLLAYVLNFVNISKATMHSNRQQQEQQQQQQQQQHQQHRCTHSNANVCQRNGCWQHVAQQYYYGKPTNSNSSSTSSGCDSNSSSKENYYIDHGGGNGRLRPLYQQQQQPQQQHHSLTPQQLQQMRQMQLMQQQQLQLLQQQLLQRRRLQQQLFEQGVNVRGNNGVGIGGNTRTTTSLATRASTTSATLTCNQQYLIQQRLQQQQQQQRLQFNNNNNNDNNNNGDDDNANFMDEEIDYFDFDMLNNNNSNNNYNNNKNNNYYNNQNVNNIVRAFSKGQQKSQRGMTEFSTNNDNNKTHLSQTLQNSPRHAQAHVLANAHHNHYKNISKHSNSPQHNKNHLLNQTTTTTTTTTTTPNTTPIKTNTQNTKQALKQQITGNNFNYQQNNQQLLTATKAATLPLHLNSSSANATNLKASLTYNSSTNHLTSQQKQQLQQQQTPQSSLTSPTLAALQHSPLHYRKPLNSPNNSPFAYAYQQQQLLQHQQQQLQQQLQQQQLQQTPYDQNTTAAATTTTPTTALQQHLLSQKLPLLTQTQYQQHLNDLLLQQQHLQQQQQQLLHSKDTDDELSEESLKQNVAIVLNNLDRYNNALRSIILNEQVNSNSSVYFDDSLLLVGSGCGVGLADANIVVGSGNNNYNTNNDYNYNNNSSNSDSSFNNFKAQTYSNNSSNNCNNNNNNNNTNNSNYNPHNLNYNNGNKMATAATPESDYNSNATTPGSRNSNILPYDSSNMQQPQQHNLVGYATGVNNCGIVGGGGSIGCGNVPIVGGGVNNGLYTFGNNVASNNLNGSLASSHDFSHDNSDYQWFIDYGYRDGCGGLQRSVLSSLSASYNGLGDLIYYDQDLAKNLDANLAEVDMESFRAEDIHSLLSQIPSYCKSLGGGNNQRMQHSLLLQHQNMLPMQQHLQQQQQQQYNNTATGAQNTNGSPNMNNILSQTSTTSTNELIDNSICKSELLFSPVKESHISVDSLDMDAYPDDGDIILTCKANKDNYTIAFEGSVVYSDESFYEPNEIAMRNKQNFINLHSNLADIVKRKGLEVSMTRSEQPFITANNKLQKSHTTQLQRYPSGNNNTIDIMPPICHAAHCSVRKSNSLPNLRDDEANAELNNACHQHQYQLQHQQQHQQHLSPQRQPLNVSQAAISGSTLDMVACKSRNLLPMCQMPFSCSSINASLTEEQLQQQQLLQQQQQRQRHRCCCSSQAAAQQQHHRHHHHRQHSRDGGSGSGSGGSGSSSSSTQQQQQQRHAHITGSTSSGNSNPPAFNLVKLFIKQKSSNCSLDDPQASAHTCMDVSSGCWPSSDAAGSSSSSSLEQRLRKKSMNDSGKGSALSRHDADEMHEQQRPRSDAVFYAAEHNVGGDDDDDDGGEDAATITDVVQRRRSMPLRHPQLCQLAAGGVSTAGSLQSSDASRSTSEQLTQLEATKLATRRSSNNANTKTGATTTTTTRITTEAATITSSTAVATTTSTSSEMITRSMQTSCGSLSTRSSLSDRFRCVPPSFLAKLNNLGEECQAPIYVIYPSYALPDLGFVKTNSAADVIFSPFNYKMAVGSGVSSSAASNLDSLKRQQQRYSQHLQDDELLKNMDYKHVVDWQSLATLLPGEYRRRLKHIPEVNGLLRELDGELSQRPLFCMSPPIRRNRTHICDCAKYFQQQQQRGQTPNANGEEVNSSSGSSSQQPSSGYRGSSTLLTDSELADPNTDPLKQMYVYQYEQQRMDSGVELSPAISGKTPPQAMPRGILRKSSSSTGAAQARNKRNSMFEEQQTKLSKAEKRRSLQEPPYTVHGIGSSEELLGDVFEEEVDELCAAMQQPRRERLSRKDMDARVRAENFLSTLPRSELKYYAEIASILESSTGAADEAQAQLQYDAAALKKEVSRALSQQKKVSFNDLDGEDDAQQQQQQLLQQQQVLLGLQPTARQQRFSTPPNSPNHSIAGGTGGAANSGALRMPPNSSAASLTRRCAQAEQFGKKASTIDERERRKIESNRFKRLQIQWELMSKDSSMLKDLANVNETKSGGSTPTAAAAAVAAANAAQKSRIPRPVSYPAGKISADEAKCCGNGKTSMRSPSRIVPPKRYSASAATIANAPTVSSPVSPAVATPTTPTGGRITPTSHVATPIGSARARTPNSRTAVTAPNTPKRRVQSPRTIPRVR